MRSFTYFLFWAALAGAPEILLSVVMDSIARTLARAAKRAFVPTDYPSISAVTPGTTAEEGCV